MSRRIEAPSENAQPASGDIVTLPAGGVSSGGLSPAVLAVSRSAADRDDDETGGPAGGATAYLHAFRRRWPLAISLGLLCGAIAIVPAWYFASDRYTATALLQIAVSEQQIIFQTGSQDSSSTFEIYKATQQQLLLSERVLTAALRKPEVAGLALVQSQDDPARWLAKKLHVEFPGTAEIMQVSLSGGNPQEVAVVVGAVVDSYMTEVVDAQRRRQRERLDEVNRLYTEKEAEMRSRRTELKQLAEQLGTGDTGALALKQQIALQQYAEGRNELSRLRSELQRAQDDLQIKQAWLAALQAAPRQAAAPEVVTDGDPTLARLAERSEDLDTRLANLQEKVKEPLRSQLAGEYAAAKKVLAESAAKRRQELRARLQNKTQAGLDPLMVELKARIDVLAAQEKAAVKDLDEQRRKAELVGNSSIDVEMMRSELQYLDKVLAPIADEREKLKVELRSTPRITLIQRPSAPKVPEMKTRLMTTAGAGFGSFFGVIFLILWSDVRKQRISSMVDVSRGLGLTVVGTLPLLPQRALVRTAKPGKQHLKLRESLNHSVDSIAARLFLRKAGKAVRVVMVSSAAQGEGKTTLAVQLATRLARTGEPTLLVDCDMRRPSIHRIFQLPRGPGFSECLREELDLAQVSRASDTDNLCIVTAGNALRDSLGPLANGVTSSFFEQARAAFNFIVIDSCPILPVIDGLLISQHADTVVLSVRRDTSETQQIVRACEKLSAFGSRNYVVVLNGSQEDVYGDYREQVIAARVEAASRPEPTVIDI